MLAHARLYTQHEETRRIKRTRRKRTAKLHVWFLVCIAARRPGRKAFREFFQLGNPVEYIPRAPGGRPLFNPRSFISVIAVLNNCISIPPPITSPLPPSSLSRLVCAKYLKSASSPIPYPPSHSTSANSSVFHHVPTGGNSRFLIKSLGSLGRDQWKEKCWHPVTRRATRCQRRFYKNWLSARANDRGGGRRRRRKKKKSHLRDWNGNSIGYPWKFYSYTRLSTLNAFCYIRLDRSEFDGRWTFFLFFFLFFSFPLSPFFPSLPSREL